LGHFSQTVFQYTREGFLEEGRVFGESNTAKLILMLKEHPGIQKRAFADLGKERTLGRNRAEAFLESFARKGSIRVETGPKNAQFFFWIEGEKDGLL
jgi:hypothetical protein